MYKTECGDAITPQVQEKPRCAALTRKGLPCKLRQHAEWNPFCYSHAPTGPVEFVGGGPLDGLCFVNYFGLSYHPNTIFIARSEDGRVVVYRPNFVWHRGTALPQDTIGVYQQAFQNLELVWQWEATAERSCNH